MTISPIDHHLILEPSKLKIHSPQLAVTVCLYSEDDHRLSLSANITNWLNSFVSEDDDEWFLVGDAMFVNAVEGDFHPQKLNG